MAMMMSIPHAPDHPILTPGGLRSVPAHVLLSAGSVAMLAAAFPEGAVPVLAWVALIPVAVLAVASARPVLMAVCAYLAGVAWWGVMVHWMVPVTGIGMVLLCLSQAVYLPATLLLVRAMHRHLHLPVTLALPLVWTSFEWLRGAWPAGGFAWFYLGHTQAPAEAGQPAGWIVQSADLFGEWTVTFLVAIVAGLAADVLTRPWRRPGSRLAPDGLLAGAAVGAVVVLGGALIYGQQRLATVERAAAAAPTAEFAAVQTNIPQDNMYTPSPEEVAHHWQRTLNLLLTAAGATDHTGAAPGAAPRVAPAEAAASDSSSNPRPPHVIVLPESIAPGPLNREAISAFTPGSFFHQAAGDLEAVVGHGDTAVLIGASAWENLQSENDRLEIGDRYNTVYLYEPGPDGHGRQDAQRYDKIHRVPFGEYLPWVEHWPWLKDIFFRYISPWDFDYSITPGREPVVFEIEHEQWPDGHMRIVAPICFEDAVARLTRRMVFDDANQRRADVMANLTNDGWFAGTSQQRQHLQLATLRSIELRTPMVRSVNTGISGFIDATGGIRQVVEVEGESRQVEGVATETVAAGTLTPLFARVGQGPVVAMVMATGLLSLVAVGLAWWRRTERP